MTEELFQALFKVQALCFTLMKVAVLLKYALFLRYKTHEWKAEHLIFFPRKEIIYSGSDQCVKVKKAQNFLSILVLLLILSVIATKNFIAGY